MFDVSKGEALLRRYVSLLFPGNKTLYNYRPDWLFGLEIDIFLPEIGVGFEFNGDQHYIVTEFGTPDTQQRRDWRKRKLCVQENVVLVIVEASELEYTKLRSKIKAKRPNVDRVFMPPMTAKTKGELKKLNKESIEYRKVLIQKYNSPTARRKGCQTRKNAFAAHKPENRVQSPKS